MDIDYDFLRNALFFSSRALSGIERKRHPRLPYISHPYRVGKCLLSNDVKDATLIAAAFLHDLLDYSDISEQTLHKIFGLKVSSLVIELADPRILKGKRNLLKSFKIGFIKDYASSNAVILSLADKLDNAKDLEMEYKTGLIKDISDKAPYYTGMLQAYEERKKTINDIVFDQLLIQFKEQVSSLWG